MIWWKEWRETRFGFLTTLFFMTGLYASMPSSRLLVEEYWIGVFLSFLGMGIAIVMGAGAVAPELSSGTVVYLLSKPSGRARFLTAKYLVRGGEVMFLMVAPVACMMVLDWDQHSHFMFVRPYLAYKYIATLIALVAFTYTSAFFCSILFKRQALVALAGITLLAAYLSARGVTVFQKIYYMEVIGTDLYIIIALTAAVFGASLLAFRMKEF